MELPEDMRRWIRTLNFNLVDIDGNPDHPLNGGIVGLANSHTAGSLFNHSRTYAKCSYFPMDLISTYLRSLDGTNVIGCIFMRADRKIFRHEQMLTNYETQTAAQIQNIIQFV